MLGVALPWVTTSIPHPLVGTGEAGNWYCFSLLHATRNWLNLHQCAVRLVKTKAFHYRKTSTAPYPSFPLPLNKHQLIRDQNKIKRSTSKPSFYTLQYLSYAKN